MCCPALLPRRPASGRAIGSCAWLAQDSPLQQPPARLSPGSLAAIRGSISQRAPFGAEVLRDGRGKLTLSVPALSADVSTLGVELAQERPQPLGRQKLAPPQAARRAATAVYDDCRAILSAVGGALKGLLPGGGSAAGGGAGASLQGPLAIARTGSDIASADALRLLEFGAILSLNLAVFNSLPLPGLDGWQLLILAIETAARKPLPESAKEGANAIAGLLFFFAFSRVLLSDVTAAGGGPTMQALGAPGGALGNAVKEYGPSVAIGIVLSLAANQQRGRNKAKQDHERLSSSSGPSGGGTKRKYKKVRGDGRPDIDDISGRWWRG